ncbi:MAG: PmbA/TldA family metallopeptidase, partial [Candidatus Gagatemarchaeaceae archaeon]
MRKEEAKDLAQAAIARAAKVGASYAEARVQRTWERQFVLKNGESQPSFFAEGYGIGIRVIAGGALGFSATNDMSRASVNAAAESAVKLAKAASNMVAKPVVLDDSKPAKKRWAPPEKTKVEDADSAWLRSVLLDIEGRISGKKAGVKLPGRLMFLGAELEERYYVNSDGARVEGRLPRVAFFASLTAMEGGSTAQRFIQQGETGGLEVVKRVGLVEKVEEEARTMGKV